MGQVDSKKNKWVCVMEQVQQELIRSNEFLAQQVWILGGLIIGLLAILGFFAKGAWTDMKEIIQSHDADIKALKEHKIRAEEKHVNTTAIVEEIKTKLDLIYQRGE